MLLSVQTTAEFLHRPKQFKDRHRHLQARAVPYMRQALISSLIYTNFFCNEGSAFSCRALTPMSKSSTRGSHIIEAVAPSCPQLSPPMPRPQGLCLPHLCHHTLLSSTVDTHRPLLSGLLGSGPADPEGYYVGFLFVLRAFHITN